MSSPPKKSGTEPATDFQSLIASPDYDPAEAGRREREAKRQRTDYQSLAKQLPDDRRRYQHRSATDFLIDALTPTLIFLMVFAVVYFLLDVRFIFTEVHDKNLRFVALCFLVGVVALNRVIARDGSDESILYMIGLAGAIGFYTLFTTGVYNVGSVAGGFLNNAWLATLFNMTLVAVLWWVTNRLVHECCIDENRTAGDVGILTGALREFRRSVQREAPAPKKAGGDGRARRNRGSVFEETELEAVDPLEWSGASKPKAEPVAAAPADRLSRRHPGISIFYFSVPAMATFALGLPVLLRGGDRFVLAGHFYVAVYTFCALMLLMLTSLSGIREYFRSRRIQVPAGIGPFWIGLGLFMIAVVMLGALQLPLPPTPHAAIVAEHEYDVWNRGSTFELAPASAATAVERIQQSRVIERLSQAVIAGMILFLIFGAIRGVGFVAAAVGRHRDRYPRWVVTFFDRLDRLLASLVSLPEPRTRRRVTRVTAANAKSGGYRNPMAGEGAESKTADVARYIAFSYDALCALADDLGVSRRRDQTPYEFLRAFPPELKALRAEARELTDLYVRSAYSPIQPEPKVLDRLRKFWMAYEKVRRRYVR